MACDWGQNETETVSPTGFETAVELENHVTGQGTQVLNNWSEF